MNVFIKSSNALKITVVKVGSSGFLEIFLGDGLVGVVCGGFLVVVVVVTVVCGLSSILTNETLSRRGIFLDDEGGNKGVVVILGFWDNDIDVQRKEEESASICLVWLLCEAHKESTKDAGVKRVQRLLALCRVVMQ